MTKTNIKTNTETVYAVYIGIDWADKRHAIALQVAAEGKIEESWLESDPESVHTWARSLGERFEGAKIAVGVELSKGALIEELRHYDFIDIYPLNPATTCRYRGAFTPSGAKDDMPDAKLHLELVTRHRDKLRLMRPKNGADRRVEILTSSRRKLVDMRTDLCNTLRSTLKNYYPLALEVGGELGTLLNCKFLIKWSSVNELKRARRNSIRAFYHANGSRRADTIEGRLDKIAAAEPVSDDPDLIEPMAAFACALARQIQTLATEIGKLDKLLQAAYAAHPDHKTWDSFPGAGATLAPRLAAAWGSDREAYEAGDMQLYSGIAPVTERSGNSIWVHRRYSRPHFIHQTFWEYAKQSYQHCEWAKHYVDAQIAKGKKHSTAVRSLAFKWIRIMFACWKQGTQYDDAKYLKALQQKNSPLAAKFPAAA